MQAQSRIRFGLGIFVIGFVLVAGSAAIAPRAAAQIPPELPLTFRPGIGAAAMGMGGAWTGVGRDYTALTYNPAALARLRRAEFGGTFSHSSTDQDNTYFRNTETASASQSGINSLGISYPFPTVRGSFVAGFSYDRILPLNSAYLRVGSGGPVANEREDIAEDGGIGAYRLGLALAVSPTLDIGLSGAVLSGSSTRDRLFVYNGTNGDLERAASNTSIDYTAVTGTFGAFMHSPSGIGFGLAVHLPEHYTLDGTLTDSSLVVAGGQTSRLPFGSERFEDKIQLPVRLSAGLSYRPFGALQGLLLAADATYADWTQINYNGAIRFDHQYAYRSTVDLRAGVEYSVPQLPLRLRAGFISQPVAYRVIGTDVFTGEAVKSTFEPDRRYGTVGAGIDLDNSLSLDAAYVFGGFTRSGISPGTTARTVEKTTDRRVYLGAMFRI